MKVDLLYTLHYIAHPWDEKARKDGVKAMCLCREIRLPPEPGLSVGVSVSYEPVAIFNKDSEGSLFNRFCAVDASAIELEHSMKDLIESERRLGESLLKK